MSSIWSYIWTPSAPLTKENLEKVNAELSFEDFQLIGPAEEDFTIVEDTQSVSSEDNTVAFVPTLESPEDEPSENVIPLEEIASSIASVNGVNAVAVIEANEDQRRIVEEFFAILEQPLIKKTTKQKICKYREEAIGEDDETANSPF
eukprot:TRINITY_DN806_c0_g1_i2.p1 TRINITY_DN806_c0_g1~~TRINITY_DN806_c0_g1_i2.p1  ORF type:complete len:147 (+),score=45.05 TRINITY_DN806_c0_g1_i2:338-778(+)